MGFAGLAMACAQGSSSVDEGDDDGTTTTAGPGGAGGTAGPTTVGNGGAGNTVGPGAGGSGAMGTGGDPSGAGGMGTGGMGTGGTQSSGGFGGTGGTGGAGTGGSGSGGAPTCTQLFLDPSFNAGSPNPSWTEVSTNAGTPLCTVTNCGNGGGTGPRTGLWWFWGGGIAVPFPNFVEESAWVEQTVTIPAGTATLDFYFQIPSCDDSTTAGLDLFGIFVDSNQVYITDHQAEGLAGKCGVAAYELRSVNLDAYADGGQHTIRFEVYQIFDSFFSSQVTNFFVDDVALTACN